MILLAPFLPKWVAPPPSVTALVGPSRGGVVSTDGLDRLVSGSDGTVVFARRDRPLLADTRTADSARDEDCYVVTEAILASASLEKRRLVSAALFKADPESLPQGLRDMLTKNIDFKSIGGGEGFQPGDRVHLAGGPGLTITEESGVRHWVILAPGTQVARPPSAERTEEVTRLPAELAKRVGEGFWKVGSGTTTLGTLVDGLALPELRLDERARDWKVDLKVRATSRTTDVLAAAIAAHGLAVRRVGAGWMIAASAGDPKDLSRTLSEARRKRAQRGVLALLAEAGAISNDAMDAMEAGPDDPGSRDRLSRLIATGRTVTPKGPLERLLADPERMRKAQIRVSFSLTVALDRGTRSVGFAVGGG